MQAKSKNSLKLLHLYLHLLLSILLQNTERMSLCDLDPPFCKVNFTGFVVQRIIPLQNYESKTSYYDVLVG